MEVGRRAPLSSHLDATPHDGYGPATASRFAGPWLPHVLMAPPLLHSLRTARVLCALVTVSTAAVPAIAQAAPTPQRSRPPVTAVGTLQQLPGTGGCVVDRSKPVAGCTPVRALQGPAPFLGSNAVALSPDGRNLYVASSTSDAIAVFGRDAKTGRLIQAPGRGGCIAAKGAARCAIAVGLDGPNSVAVSADGRNVYATSSNSSSVAIFARNGSTGALTQATDGSGCIADAPMAQCTTGRALGGADVVTVSPDGRSVYVGAFFANAVSTFVRDPSTGTLTQPSDATGCVVNAPTYGCTTGLALAAPEGMAISADGTSVYVASALANALVSFARDPSTGTLTQATDGSGCVVNAPLAGCTTGTRLSGANAVAVSSDDTTVYVTSLFSNSVTTFARTPPTGAVTQHAGTSACVISVLAVGCSLGRAFTAPEGIAVSSDGSSVYAAASGSGAVDVLDRDPTSGALMQKPRAAGCITARGTSDCMAGRALVGTSSVAVSPDGRYVYAGAFGSNAVSVFRRITKEMTRDG